MLKSLCSSVQSFQDKVKLNLRVKSTKAFLSWVAVNCETLLYLSSASVYFLHICDINQTQIPTVTDVLAAESLIMNSLALYENRSINGIHECFQFLTNYHKFQQLLQSMVTVEFGVFSQCNHQANIYLHKKWWIEFPCVKPTGFKKVTAKITEHLAAHILIA